MQAVIDSRLQAVKDRRMQVVLAGNPNAGKTTLFNALTHSNLKTGNWHGVTTFTAKKCVHGVIYADVAGAYSLNPFSMEEKEAIEDIKKADLIINVIDALTLKNSLAFTKSLVSLNKNVIVYITKIKKLRANGGSVDAKKLEKCIGVPVYTCTPKQLKNMVEQGSFMHAVEKCDVPLDGAYTAGNAGLKPIEKLVYNKFFALSLFVAIMVLTFFLTFHPKMIGTILKDRVEELVCKDLYALVYPKFTLPVLRSFVCEGLIVPCGSVLSFLPQLALLYFTLITLEESGVASALSFVTDGIFERVNLSGRAVFSLVSGFGCTATAIPTTRGYFSPTAQKRTIAVLPFIPCGAKLPVFLTLLSPVFVDPFPVICVLYFSGVALAVFISSLMKGKGEELITEIAPVYLPDIATTLKKLFFYLKGFIIKVLGVVALFSSLSWFLSKFDFALRYVEVEESMLCALSKAILPLFVPMGIKDWRIAYSAVSGFTAKENVAATIALLVPSFKLPLPSALGFCAFMLTCPACVSAFGASTREIGFKTTLKFNLIQLILSFAIGYAVAFITSIL